MPNSEHGPQRADLERCLAELGANDLLYPEHKKELAGIPERGTPHPRPTVTAKSRKSSTFIERRSVSAMFQSGFCRVLLPLFGHVVAAVQWADCFNFYRERAGILRTDKPDFVFSKQWLERVR